MKKILFGLILVSFLTVLLASIDASAASGIGIPTSCKLKYDFSNVVAGCTSGTTIALDDVDKGVCCILNTVYNVSDWIFVILVGVAVVFIAFGGLKIVTAGGSSESVEEGRKFILYAITGLVVALLAKTVPSIIKLIIGT